MKPARDAALVSTDWLESHFADARVRVVDGSWYLPHLRRDPRREFADAHVPGAVFFDIDAIADTKSALPHMLPTAEQFGVAVGQLGIGNEDHVVVYDGRGVTSAARVWWMFRVFGHASVAVLDGGLPKWRAEGRRIEHGTRAVPPAEFKARLAPALVRDLAQMRANLANRPEQIVDARSRGRFMGREPEPRAGLRGGHIPGSLNVPYEQLGRGDTGAMRDERELRQLFQDAGVDLARPIVTTCGSGVSAAVLALGLYRLGQRDVALYDGSWAEWGGQCDTPVETTEEAC